MNPPTTRPALDRLVWIDQQANTFETAWRQGNAPRIENLVDDAPPEWRADLACELILLERELESARGEPRPVADYLARFPDHARRIEALCRLEGEAAPSDDAAPPVFQHYELTQLLGRGGMGMVYLGRKRDRVEEHCVAVKMLRGAVSGEGRERFLTEMATMARLQHPHIVPILDSGYEQNDKLYFVMPYFPRGDLAHVLAASGRPSPRTAAEYALAIAWALAYLHERGIVHRDLKLRNVLLDDYCDGRFPLGRPWLTDFGLVKLTEREPTLERDQITGTVLSMSPEQAAGRNTDVGPHSDLWALGVLLFEMLTGRTPFTGSTVDEVRYQILRREPPLARSLRGEVPRDLERIVAKCLEKRPEDRYRSAAEVIEDLTLFLRNEPLVHALPRRTAERLERWARRKPALSMRLTVIIVLLANVWINRAAWALGWKFEPRPGGPTWPGAIAIFMDFWFDQILLLTWGVLSWLYQRKLDRQPASVGVRGAWLVTDAAILFAILWNVEALHSPLIVALAALIVASGLWQEVRLVALTTFLASCSYVALVALAAWHGDVSPLYEILHMLTTFVVLGVLTSYFIRRTRIIEQIYRQEPVL